MTATTKINTISDIRSLIDANGGTIYVRWSAAAAHDMRPGAVSRDYASGDVHCGLSAVPLTSDMEDWEIAKYVSEYMFLRLKGTRIAPRFYAATEVGQDSDGYPSIAPTMHLGSAHISLVEALDANLSDKLRLQQSIARAEAALAAGKGDTNFLTVYLAESRAELEKLA